MGVPAFFRWLSRKYPSIVIHCNEETVKEVNGIKIPIDTSQPNPNDIEFDNLYLDMNGIIHPCSHPEDRPAPKNEEEIMLAIFEAIDRLFAIVRPRRLLYMAIDGVAPRAKMNQQRSRRFRASKESFENSRIKADIKAELRAKGALLPEDDPKAEKFDSNCITPGTEFMFRLAACLRFYVLERLNNDPGWKNIEVILSDANVPGEGEHKIMDFIRRQRGQPNHDPNTHHCICGADADLIMLGLATHEPNFTIIREEFKPNQPRPCGICAQYGHEMDDCCGLPKVKEGEHDELQAQSSICKTNYIFIRICVIREYIRMELDMPGLPFEYDFENVVDDWVMMCFFVGNDFLPHLPSLEIREGAIDKLVRLYKDIVHHTGGYLTKNGHINLDRVEKIMRGIGRMEDEIFRKRRESDLNYRAREKSKRQKKQSDRGPSYVPEGQFAPIPLGSKGLMPPALSDIRSTARDMRTSDLRNLDAASSLRAMLHDSLQSSSTDSVKRKKEDNDDEPDDDVRLWEDGWKERYYKSKFDVSMKDFAFRRKVVRSYVEGLCWVLSYYYQGCASWTWFFPFHYAPFASDFVDIIDVPSQFSTSNPKKPLEQLMCVFPAASGQFLPNSWRILMNKPESPIIDFYPEDFQIDLNGKKYAWQGVALLPFVDEERMIGALKHVYPDLSAAERMRNSLGNDILFVGRHHALYSFFKGLGENNNQPLSFEEAVDIDPALTKGMAGKVWKDSFCSGPTHVSAPLACLEDLKNNCALSMSYKDPVYPDGHVFEAKLLPGARFPEVTVKPRDFSYKNNRGRNSFGRQNPRNWQPRIGFDPHRNHQRLHQSSHRHLNHHLHHRSNNDSYRPPFQNAYPSQRPYYSQEYNQQNRNNRWPRNDSWGPRPEFRQQQQSHRPRWDGRERYPDAAHQRFSDKRHNDREDNSGSGGYSRYGVY
ncbi:unnamed protein product [Clavelina lepadiformis]|uniref:5'-3' exoribonuclease n=1 Tax=Clavelina lepadiformis TaxID=159417 RepID=A0ABP0GIM6_CLALP